MCESGFGSDSFCLFVCFGGFVRFLFGWLVLFYFFKKFSMCLLPLYTEMLQSLFCKVSSFRSAELTDSGGTVRFLGYP